MTRADAIKNEIECIDIVLKVHGLPTYSAMREQRDELLAALMPFTARSSSEETITITVRTADVTRARAATDKATS